MSIALVSPDQISTIFNIWSHKCPLASGTVSYWLSTSHCCPLLTLYTALSHRNAQLSLDLVSTSFHTQYSKQRVFHNNFLWWKIDTAKSRLLTALCTLLRMCPRFRRWDHAHSTELTHPRTTRAPAFMFYFLQECSKEQDSRRLNESNGTFLLSKIVLLDFEYM